MKIISEQPRLIVCASLWSLVAHPTTRREWSLTRKLAAIKDAGFDGIAETFRPELAPHLRRLQLKICGRVFSRTGSDVRTLLEIEAAGGAHYVNCMLGEHDTTPAAATKIIIRTVRAAQKLGLSAHIETHRDTCTETPEKIAEISRLFTRETGEPLPLTWDHSHPAVMKHVLPQDYSKRLLDSPRLIQHSHLFHCRPFNSQHCQIPVTNGKGKLTPEFNDYLSFAEDLFAMWLQGPAPRGELWICPELGTTVGYNVSTNPPVWPDTIRCRLELLKSWERAKLRARNF
ncbi:xylose isomerase [Nibricoccus aquaticus]|uniref:Xylose isomerase n=1 Tax=Nibricoccus aquaticus TaxID=2576891 RepID=A0A290Q8N6_9BACT|nr:xylose isomerase [Nibricoccus aquaticus]ATC64607.1 xylose isomerase [Nibricoccus aquaticus]